MPPYPSVYGRLGLTPPSMLPIPAMTPGPGVVAATQNPAAGAVTEVPPAGPAMLPTTTAQPLYDPTKPPVLPYPTGDGAGDGWQGALQRALVGFSKGASRVQVDPTYNPVGAGIVGGGETIGANVSDAINRRLALQMAIAQPFRDAQNAALKKSYESAAEAPFKAKDQQDELNREIAAHKANIDTDTDPKYIEPLAQNLAGLPPTLRQIELSRQSGPARMVLVNRIFDINKDSPITDEQREKNYQASMAGSVAGATYNAGAGAQNSARAANTVQMLLPDLQKASDAFTSRSDNARFLNTPLNAINEQTGTEAQTFKQYILDTKAKMATALVNGGAPQAEAQAKIDSTFPDTMLPSQVPAAIKTINAIMDTQKKGALTPVTLAPTAPAVSAAPAAPVAGGSTWRKY